MDILFWILVASAVIGLAVSFYDLMEEFDDEE